MGFYRKPEPTADELKLELSILEEEVVAAITGPISQSASITVENLPVNRAVRLAAELSERFQVDVAVVDPHELWHR